MLFKRIVITSLLGLATLGCSERPTDGVASPPGGGNSGTTKPKSEPRTLETQEQRLVTQGE